MGRVRVFLALSLDGFIAGPQDELDWLEPSGEVEDTFGPFLAEVGALVMGRRTYDVVRSFAGPWPYGERPLIVATHRPLEPAHAGVRAMAGDIVDLVAAARTLAGERDVYLDGGQLVRQALAAGLVDELTLTVIPLLLREGISLFGGLSARQPLLLEAVKPLGAGFVQLRYACPAVSPG
ncbi:MAG: dihydrofolate reductase family protein [Candidatus Sericytochromatia bacterium]|nr:dihydrofolate reductase family protein [Candidatus Sericytochromatia bacterium]